MLTRQELKDMIHSEIAAARKELSEGAPVKLTREHIRRIVIEEATAMRRSSMAPKPLSLIEAFYGEADEAKGMIYGSSEGRACEQCGAMYEMPIAKCQHCGASMAEYVSRGMSGIGKNSGVDEAKSGKRKSMRHPAPKDDPTDLGGMTPKTAKGMVNKISRAPGPTFSNIVDFAKGWDAENPAAYAGSLMRTAGMEPARGPRRKGKK
jgi:hypothetical protein